LISALEAANKRVIAVVIAGRPVGLGAAAEGASAVLMAYQGSTEAGQAVADVIFGKVNPSGKLSVSWPSDAAMVGGDFNGGAPSPLGDQPKFFDQLPGTGSGQGHEYNPLYPFGFGLSYTSFQTSGLSVTSQVSAEDKATATFTVTNTGPVNGSDIVPVYVSQPLSGVVVPPQRLVGWAKVNLDAGASRQVTVSFPLSTLGVSVGDINSAAPPRVQPGRYQVVLDKNTTTPYDVAQTAPFSVSGEPTEGSGG
jgi:beta-glucosidase